MIYKLLLGFLLITSISGCKVVKEYQKVDLNDPDMSLSEKDCDKNVTTAQSYREGATGATSGKTGGGCGCN